MAQRHSARAATPALLDRRELVARLDRAVAKKVTVIAAPAGSGKTSLLRLWSDRPDQHRRVAFVSVRPGQPDAQSFWLTLLGAVRGTATPAATPEFDVAAAADQVLAAIAATSTAEAPFVLVIDDLHELTAPRAGEQLMALLANLPPHAHAILASRADPLPDRYRRRLAGELADIGGAELNFTERETRDLVVAEHLALSEQAAVRLHERTEGWAAGLRLAVLALAGHPEPERFVAEFSGSDRTVGEYLLAEALDRQPQAVRRLLLRTSVLERVNGELADLLTGTPGSARLLRDLEDANAFVVALDADRTWFRCHRMFAEMLRLVLRRTQAQDIPVLHRLAARWFTAHALSADAIRHLQAAADWAEAARALSEHALSLTLDGQGDTVAALLRSFPVATADASELALAHAIAALGEMRLDEAAAHLTLARSYAATAARPDRLRLANTAVELLLARLRGHFDGIRAQADVLGAPVTGPSSADIKLGHDLRAVVLLNLGVTEAWSLRLADSARHLQAGAALAHDLDRPYLEVACRAHLGFASIGDSLPLAGQRCAAAIDLAARHGWDTEPVIAPALLTLAATLTWTGEFDRARHWLARAREVTRAAGEPGIRLLVHLASAMLAAGRGRPVEALADFAAAARVQARMAGEHALFVRVLAGSVASQARAGRLAEARAALSAVDERRAARGEIRVAAAALRLAEADPAGARRELRPVLDGTAAVNPYLTLVEAHLLDALASRDLGQPESARHALNQALDLAERDRLILPFLLTGGWELLETQPLSGTAHAGLIADILAAAGQRDSAPRHRPPD